MFVDYVIISNRILIQMTCMKYICYKPRLFVKDTNQNFFLLHYTYIYQKDILIFPLAVQCILKTLSSFTMKW